MSDGNWIDIVCAVIMLASILLSILRGLIQEVASLAVWILALVAASRLAEFAADPFRGNVPEAVALTLGFLAVLIITLLVGRLVTAAIKGLVHAVGGNVIDRILGISFGLARGMVIITVLAVMAAMTPLVTQPTWKEARLRPVLEFSIQVAAPWLPAFVASRVSLETPASPPIEILGRP